MSFRITSFGAAEEVTGSKHMLHYKDTCVLLDCGMFQGRRAESRAKNDAFGFDPHKVDAVLLSHAHIDHCGLLPKLVKEGFTGPIFCTNATAGLLEIMLRDSAHIQEDDEKYFTAHPQFKTPFPTNALYHQSDVDETLALVQVVHRHESFDFKDISATYYPAGHVLGAACIRVVAGEKKLLYSGDLGRDKMPLLIDRELGIPADTILMESTYGGRLHDPITLAQEKLETVINRTIKRGGKVLIPSFALERTQEILYYLEESLAQGNLPNVPIYVDSPMAIAVTELFQKHPDYYDTEMRSRYRNTKPFDDSHIHFTETVRESKEIHEKNEPCIIISASGMCEAGRIRHHLKNYIEDKRNTVLIVGYMAVHTLGRKLIEKAKKVSILGENRTIHAEIIKLNTFSGHADEPDLLSWANSVQGAQRVILVHGERPGQDTFRERLLDTFDDVHIMERGETLEL